MIRPESPCLDCEDRHERCHAVCERYKDYAEEMAEYNAEVKANRMKEYVGSITDRTRFGWKRRKKGE